MNPYRSNLYWLNLCCGKFHFHLVSLESKNGQIKILYTSFSLAIIHGHGVRIFVEGGGHGRGAKHPNGNVKGLWSGSPPSMSLLSLRRSDYDSCTCKKRQAEGISYNAQKTSEKNKELGARVRALQRYLLSLAMEWGSSRAQRVRESLHQWQCQHLPGLK